MKERGKARSLWKAKNELLSLQRSSDDMHRLSEFVALPRLLKMRT